MDDCKLDVERFAPITCRGKERLPEGVGLGQDPTGMDGYAGMGGCRPPTGAATCALSVHLSPGWPFVLSGLPLCPDDSPILASLRPTPPPHPAILAQCPLPEGCVCPGVSWASRGLSHTLAACTESHRVDHPPRLSSLILTVETSAPCPLLLGWASLVPERREGVLPVPALRPLPCPPSSSPSAL